MQTKSPKKHAASKRPLRKLLAGLIAASTAVAAFLIPLPASASSPNYTNDPATYLNENFNQTGFAKVSQGIDPSVEIIGVTSSRFFEDRRVAFSLEDGKVILRAFKPTTAVEGSWSSWELPSITNHPVFDYGLDTTFGTAGSLDLGITGVVSAALSNVSSSRPGNTVSSRQPWLVVNVVSGSTTTNVLYKFTAALLGACGTAADKPSCAAPADLDITTSVAGVAGAGARVTGFAHANSDTTFFVSGTTTAGQPFLAELNSSDGTVKTSETPNPRQLVFGAAAFDASTGPNGYLVTDKLEHSTFVPAKNGLQMVDNLIYMAGSLEKSDGTQIGVLYIRKRADFTPAARDPQLVFDVGHDTRIETMFSDSTLGGSYKVESSDVAKPFMVAAGSVGGVQTYFSYKLPATGDGKLLGINYTRNQSPVGSSVTAIASDGISLRAYTWTLLGAVNDSPPRETQILTLTGVSGAVTSGDVTLAIDASPGSGMLAFAAFEDGTEGTIVVASVQSRTVIPRYTSAPLLELVGDFLRAETVSTRELLSFNPTISHYSCSNEVAVGSSLTESTPEVPSGCSVISGLVVQGSGAVDTTTSQNEPLLVGHVIRKFTHTNPDFVYWTNSVDFTGNGGGGGEPTPPTTPSQPVPQTLSGGGGAPSILTTDLQPSATSTAGNGVAASVSAGVATPVSATVTRVTSTSPSVIQTQATDLKTAFDSKGSGDSPITVVNTPTGANIFGLIKNTATNQPIGVPAQDVLMVATSTQAILLAAARNNQPARVNPNGVLVVNNGGVLGAAARGFANNTPGELVLLSTPTLLGTFTTDGNGTFAGQALVPAGFPVGDHTAVLVTAGLITSMGLTVEAAASSPGSDSGWSAPVAKPAEVMTKTKAARFNNFVADSGKLTKRAKLWISRNTRSFQEVNSVVCTGFTSGVRATAATRKLAQDRATRACNLAKRIAPEATIQVRIKPATGVGPNFRSVRVKITGK